MRLSGVAPNIDIVPFDHCIDSLERAVKERVFFVKNVPDKTKLDIDFTTPPKPIDCAFDRLESTYHLLKKHLPSTAPLTHRQFVDGYKGRKRVVYERALAELSSGDYSIAEDAKVSVFIKHEKTDRTSKRDPVPRVISPRNPRFNIRLGRYLKPLEERIFKSLGKLFGHRTVMKGMDVRQTAKIMREKWDMFHHPVAVGLDASRFDQHVSVEALEFEHNVYLDCFKTSEHRKKLGNILKHQLENKCTGYAEDGSLHYTTNGTRMSGDMNTSLGNCVLMCTMIHAYLEHVGVSGQLANNGDDCVVFMEKSDLGKFSTGLFDWFWDMGFNMAIEPAVYEFAHIEFCQCKPVFDGHGWIMCRNPITAIAKDAVLLKSNFNMSRYRLWLKAVGQGGLAIAGGIPIFQNFYQMCVRNGVSSYTRARKNDVVRLDAISSDEILPFFMREHGIKGNEVAKTITPECRASFWEAWGVTPDAQIQLEKYYDDFTVGEFGDDWVPRSIFTEIEDCLF